MIIGSSIQSYIYLHLSRSSSSVFSSLYLIALKSSYCTPFQFSQIIWSKACLYPYNSRHATRKLFQSNANQLYDPLVRASSKPFDPLFHWFFFLTNSMSHFLFFYSIHFVHNALIVPITLSLHHPFLSVRPSYLSKLWTTSTFYQKSSAARKLSFSDSFWGFHPAKTWETSQPSLSHPHLFLIHWLRTFPRSVLPNTLTKYCSFSADSAPCAILPTNESRLINAFSGTDLLPLNLSPVSY